MSWKIIQSVQKATDLRLILPFGLNLKLGDVVSVAKEGGFTLEGDCKSLLATTPGSVRSPQDARPDFTEQEGDATKYVFRAAGKASSLFPELPKMAAGFDLSFGAVDSWLLAIVGRNITSLANTARFRKPILDAYARGVWKPDWALVISVAKVAKMTLIASTSSNAKVALSIAGTVSPDASMEAKLTADCSITAANQQLFKCLTNKPMTAFCSALRVKDRWWGDVNVGTLSTVRVRKDVRSASDQDFWENMDDDISPYRGGTNV
jgi:hypothetical protein